LADAIEKEFKVRPQLIKGRGGVFEVMADKELIFSKKAAGRFPEHEEVLAMLR
jgi:selT/selW/selH-like putative selenoprotein